MILSYTDILGDKKRHRMSAEVTTDHPSSSYGIPVITIEDGNSLDLSSWLMLDYKIVKASKEEKRKLEAVFENFSAILGKELTDPAL